MFAPLKRIMILATVLMFPAVASAYVTMENFEIDNNVPVGNDGFAMSFEAVNFGGNAWKSTRIDFNSTYTDICINHDDMAVGPHTLFWFVEWANSNDADSTSNRAAWLYPYYNSNCSGNNWSGSVPTADLNRTDEVVEPPLVTNFIVEKSFRPMLDNQSVNVHISCSAGLPGDDDASLIGDSGIQQFPQVGIDITDPLADCNITETTNVPGYMAMYYTNEDELLSLDGCFFQGSFNMREVNFCSIVNVGLPATFTITKEWEIFQDEDARFVTLEELRVRLGASCTNDIMSVEWSDEGSCKDDGDDTNSEDNGCSDDNSSDDSSMSVMVLGDAIATFTVANDDVEPVVCRGMERVRYSNVETTESTCHLSRPSPSDVRHKGPPQKPFTILAGGSAGCGFVNTVFFEGIPTLSQYGMALMALLMLGVGFVGFRRFV